VRRVSKPGIPLAGYESQSAFKLFSLDCGLLGAMSRLDARSLVEGNEVFVEFKGALTEQYVLQELLCRQDIPVAYWEADGGTAEVDFVAQMGGLVVPIEVKAGVNLRARSLASYKQRYAPGCGIRTSLAPWERQDWLYNMPLYAIGSAETLVEKTEAET
jgi:predicted AAA+ superfamily ATPase